MNELPLHKVFTLLDGVSKGPNIHDDPVGRNLLDVNKFLISHDFLKVTLSDKQLHNLQHVEDISSDQAYLRDIILIINSGIVPANFASRSSGKLGYARWLTTANRILRFYIS